jgi:hypothetical protein
MRSLTLTLTLAAACTAALGGAAHAMTRQEAVQAALVTLGTPEAKGEVLFAEDFDGDLAERWNVDAGWTVVDGEDGDPCGQVISGADIEDLVLAKPFPVEPGHPIAVTYRTRCVTGGEPIFLRVDFFDADGVTGDPYARQDISRTGDGWVQTTMLVSDWFPGYTRQMTVHFHLASNSDTTALLDTVRVVDLAGAVDAMLAQELSDQIEALAALRTEVADRGPAADDRVWRGAVERALDQATAELDACRGLEPGSTEMSDALGPPSCTIARLTDLVAALDAGEPRLPTTRPLLTYAVDPMQAMAVLPGAAKLPGALADGVALTACPGEAESGSVVLWAPEAVKGVTLEVGDLRGPGGTIPARAVDVRWVKCWYQSGGAPYSVGQNRSSKALVPELLLYDDELVHVDLAAHTNMLRLSFADGARYTDINDPTDVPWGWSASLEDYPVRDADSLQPLDLPARENRQAWITVRVPADAAPGGYRGTLSLDAAGEAAGALDLAVEVLPFTLAEPKTHYDPEADYTGSLYYWGQLDPTGEGRISYCTKSEEQFGAELRHMRDHDIVAPVMILPAPLVYDDEPLFRRTLQIMRETGMSGRPLYFGSSDMIGAPADLRELDTLKANVAKTVAIAAEYGFTEVYFYGLDEATGDRLASQRAAWAAVHEAGGKVIVSGFRGQFEAVGDILDLCNWAGPPEAAQAEGWHDAGHRVWNYANPQTPVEDPAVYRRNYGLLLWKSNYDGTCTYCYMDSSGTPWNDFDCDAYRDHEVAYPTVNGVVPTLALEGLREGLDDVKYATTLRQVAAEALADGSAERKADAEAALAWLEAVDPHSADLNEVRDGMVERILALR